MYNGEHSITFTSLDGTVSKNTWTEWHLIPTSRPTVSVPGAQNKFVEIPGMDGSYDISDYLRADVAYTDRSGTFEFVVDNDHEDWLTIYQSLLMFLHGQRLRMTLVDDDGWYYEGRFTVNEWKSDKVRSAVSISYRVAPFKCSIYPEYVENILWDPFCFERDMDWSALWHVELNGGTEQFRIESYGVRTAVQVRLVSGEGGTASFGGVTGQLSEAGQEAMLGYGSRGGTDILTISGTGVFDIGWRKTGI